MIKIDKEVENILINVDGIGHYSMFGAVIGEAQFVLYYPKDSHDVFLAHTSEFEREGLFVKLKE